MAKVGVVGTTSWGTTLAIILARRGVDVCLWARTEEEAERLRAENQNSRLLPCVEFPTNLDVTASAEHALAGADLAIIAVPSSTLRDNARKLDRSIGPSTIVVSATKGLEMATGERMSQILEAELSSAPPICAMSGPNLAAEIIQGKPSSTVVASPDVAAAATAQSLITSTHFRVYTNEDLVGVELGGALKNIIAVGAGICDGLEYGDNAKAAFITRGLAEITRLGVAAGANPSTFAGLAGMGDLVATCAGTLSRNHQVGERLAKGETQKEIRATMRNVAEGVDTSAAAMHLARELGVEMPITSATFGVLFEAVPLRQAIADLLGRAPRPE